MSDREPSSMEEFFAAEYQTAPTAVADVAEVNDDDANFATDDQPVGTAPVNPTEDQSSGDDRIAQIEAQLESMRAEVARRDQQLTDMMRSARQNAEQQRNMEIQRARARWERGIATGELSELDILKEREQLIARHATERITNLEAENTQLRTTHQQAQEQEARVQVIDMLAAEYNLTDRERGYIERLNDPYTMEDFAREFQSDRKNQTQAARQTQAQSRSRNPVDRSPTTPSTASRGAEPGDMLSFFKTVRRPGG